MDNSVDYYIACFPLASKESKAETRNAYKTLMSHLRETKDSLYSDNLRGLSVDLDTAMMRMRISHQENEYLNRIKKRTRYLSRPDYQTA